MESVILSILETYGLTTLVVLFGGYFAYRYLTMRLNQMEKDFDTKLKARVYTITGMIDTTNDGNSMHLQATIQEMRTQPHTNPTIQRN